MRFCRGLMKVRFLVFLVLLSLIRSNFRTIYRQRAASTSDPQHLLWSSTKSPSRGASHSRMRINSAFSTPPQQNQTQYRQVQLNFKKRMKRNKNR